MVQSLKLGGGPAGEEGRGIRRLNRLPIIIAIVLVIIFFAVIFYGLTTRGLYFRRTSGPDTASSSPASTYADQLKRGISNGIIGDQTEAQPFQPAPPPETTKPASNPFATRPPTEAPATSQLEPEALSRTARDFASTHTDSPALGFAIDDRPREARRQASARQDVVGSD